MMKIEQKIEEIVPEVAAHVAEVAEVAAAAEVAEVAEVARVQCAVVCNVVVCIVLFAKKAGRKQTNKTRNR